MASNMYHSPDWIHIMPSRRIERQPLIFTGVFIFNSEMNFVSNFR